MKVLAGDFKTGTALIHRGRWGLGKHTHINMPKGFLSYDRVELKQIATVKPLAENGVDWGATAAGGLALGPIGLLAGLASAGRKLLAIEFKDGRRAMVECEGSELKVLLAAVF